LEIREEETNIGGQDIRCGRLERKKHLSSASLLDRNPTFRKNTLFLGVKRSERYTLSRHCGTKEKNTL
jgi:hypothetical protein